MKRWVTIDLDTGRILVEIYANEWPGWVGIEGDRIGIVLFEELPLSVRLKLSEPEDIPSVYGADAVLGAARNIASVIGRVR